MTYYRQCAIQRKLVTVITWLPEEYAIKDKTLRIKMFKVWQDDWEVLRVFTVKISEEDMKGNEDIYILSKNIEGPTPPYGKRGKGDK